MFYLSKPEKKPGTMSLVGYFKQDHNISFTNDNFIRSMQKEFQFVILNFMLILGQKYYLTLFM